MDTGGRPLSILKKIREHYPVALHGTALSIGSSDPINLKYLERLKRLIHEIDPFVVSDHLCWSGVQGEVLHDLLPLPYNDESIEHVVRRITQVQDYLKKQILIENVSTYADFKESTMPEWEFISQIARRAGCGILLDVNNIFVNAFNHRFDANTYIEHIPAAMIGQIHISGHTDRGSFLFDTHSKPIKDEVWRLYEKTLKEKGPISTIVEWDEDIPPFDELAKLGDQARTIYEKIV